MSQSSDTRPCPFCGELIKVAAVKCRFCGEFLDKSLPLAQPDEDEPQSETKTSVDQVLFWILPVGRNFFAIAASYFGFLALVPYSMIAFALFPSEARRETQRMVMLLGLGLNCILGFLAMALGVIGVVLVLQGYKRGLPRSIIGIICGLAGVGVYSLFVLWFIRTYIGW